MNGMNNFITDLLDEMIINDARSLEISPVEAFPISFIFEGDEKHAVHVENDMSDEELLDDLAALGLSSIESYFYDYESESAGEKLSVKCSIRKTGDFVTVKFYRAEFSMIAQTAIQKVNPIQVDKVMDILSTYIFRTVK